MLNTSLLEILRTLSKDELNKFDDFVKSPYYNKKVPVANLWKVIKKYFPKFNSEELERKKIYFELFQGKDFNYGVMKNLIYDLTRLAENFLTLESFQQNEFQKKNQLMSVLLDREMKTLVSSKFDNFVKSSLEMSFTNDLVREDYFFYMWRSYRTKWNFENELVHSKNYDNIINLSSDFFLANFLIHAFIIYHNIEGQKVSHNYSGDNSSIELFLKKIYDKGIINDLIKSIKPISTGVSSVLNVYFRMFISIVNKDSDEKYLEFKETLIKNVKLFSKRDLQALYITLLNCLIHLKSKKISGDTESIEIYDYMIESNILFNENERVWDQDFISYVISASSLGRYEAIENFIKKVINRMQNDTRDNLLNFAYAHIYFIKREYGKSLEILAKINYDLFTMKYSIKNLQLKIFYELNDINSFELALDSYQHFLDKNKSVSDKWKKVMKTFCNFIERLKEQKENYNEIKFKKLKEEILTHFGDHKVWTVRKVEEIEIQRNILKTKNRQDGIENRDAILKI